jgi:excisionase family DNA binding protein
VGTISQNKAPEAAEELEPLLSVAETSKRLGVSQWFIRELVRRGELPAVRLGDRVLVRPPDLRAFIEKRLTKGVKTHSRPGEAGPPTGDVVTGPPDHQAEPPSV